jgi:CheY-like chemotaxis protein
MSFLDPLLLALNEPVFETDFEGEIRAATPALHAMLGFHPSERATLFQGFIAAARPRIEQALKRIAEGKTPSAFVEARIAGADGPGIAVEIKLIPWGGDGKTPQGICGWIRDLSALRQSEQAATVQGMHLFNLVENVDDACLVESPEGSVESLNAAFCNLFGMAAAPQSLIGMEAAEVFAGARTASGCKDGPRMPDDNGALILEFSLARGSKSKLVKQRIFPIVIDGVTLGRLHLFKMGEKKSAAAEAVQTTASQLEIVERIARELAITVESAGSAIHRAEQMDLPAAVIEHFQRVEVSARAAFTAVGGLLDFSKFEPSEIKSLKLEQNDLNLRETLSTLIEHVAALADEKGLQLRLRVEQDVPAVLVGDAPRLLLVLRNLLETVIGAFDPGTGQGDISLVIAPEYASEGKIHLHFGIEASSAGKAAKLRPFTPLALMQLAIARQMIKAMGGELEAVHRKEASGQEFALAFPWREDQETRTRPSFVTLTALPVLIVSADAAQRHELAALMRSWRMLPQEADNATMAIQLLLRLESEGNPIPLVILSNELPVQDGFLLAFRIKRHPRLKQTIVMMLAKTGRPGDAIACRENGIIAYLRHPLSPNQLNEAIIAVTGVDAADDSDVTHTLITRHSLRESRRATILLIDGNRETHLAAGNMLRKRGYILTEAEDADQAIDALDKEIYDLILVDTKTPGMEDAVKSLRSLVQKNADTVVIVALSSDTSEANRKKCEEAGFNGFLAKPLVKEAVLGLLAAKLPEREHAAD